MHKHSVNRDNMTPKEAFKILAEGNLRFRNNLLVRRDLLNIVNLTQDTQKPFASILSCSDSRTAAEIVFDQGLGDIFSVRLAGNVASRYAMASIEYACVYLGTKLVVVLGHTNCGAVRAACDDFQEGYIGELVTHIKPAVQQERKNPEDNSSNISFVNQVCKCNVDLQMQTILEQSTILKSLLDKKQIGLVGGLYDVKNGQVDFHLKSAIF